MTPDTPIAVQAAAFSRWLLVALEQGWTVRPAHMRYAAELLGASAAAIDGVPPIDPPPPPDQVYRQHRNPNYRRE